MTDDDTPDERTIEMTDNGLRLSLPDAHDELRAAGSAALILADLIEGRHGDGADLAEMLRSANDAAQDVIRYDGVTDADPARVRVADVLVLGWCAGWWYRIHQRDHNKPNSDIDTFGAAAEVMVDVMDRVTRIAGIASLGGDVETTDHSYR